jgi:hypothetical protein
MRTVEGENMVLLLILNFTYSFIFSVFYLELIILFSIDIWNKIAGRRVVIGRDFPLSHTIFVTNLV